MAAVPDRPPPLPADRARADHPRRLRPRPPRRGEGTRAGAAAEGSGGRVGRRLLSVLVPEPGARGASCGDRPRGVPRRVPLRLLRGAAAVPRVRALLDRLPERVHRPARLPLCPPARGGARGDGREDRAPPDDLGERGRHGRGRDLPPGEPAHVGPRRGCRRRHLGRAPGGLRERDHTRRGRHVRGHRRSPRTVGCG